MEEIYVIVTHLNNRIHISDNLPKDIATTDPPKSEIILGIVVLLNIIKTSFIEL